MLRSTSLFALVSLTLAAGCGQSTARTDRDAANIDAASITDGSGSDTGVASDAGAIGTDTGSTGVDSGSTDVDSGSVGTDAGTSDIDSGSTGTDAGSTDVDAASSSCITTGCARGQSCCPFTGMCYASGCLACCMPRPPTDSGVSMPDSGVPPSDAGTPSCVVTGCTGRLVCCSGTGNCYDPRCLACCLRL